jgi:tripartite-type tricarboxylate transporter receptor subunit TctC
VFIANPASGIKSMADLIAQARAKPGTIAMANAGIGTTPQLACEWLKSITGVNITSVPFNGAGPAMQATLGGQVPVMGASLPGAHPGIMNGSLTALAVTGATRWPDMPNVPTMVELGYKDFVSDTFHGIWAPAGTSPEIVAVLTKACLDVLKQPDFAKQLLASGFEIIGNGPDGLRKRVEREVPLYKELIAKAKIERM